MIKRIINNIIKIIKAMFLGDDFDDLFEKYFGKPSKKQKKQTKSNNKNNNKGYFGPSDMSSPMDLLNYIYSNPWASGYPKIDDLNLGKPDEHTTFTEDGVDYEKKVWHTKDGDIIQMSAKSNIEFTPEYFNTNNIPFGSKLPKKELPLEKQLELAIKNENYEKAAKIRDMLNTSNNKNNNSTENKTDSWNF